MSDSTLTNPLLRTLREGGLAASLIVRLFDGPRSAASPRPPAWTRCTSTWSIPLSLQSASRICNATREAGVTPLVRVPAIDAALIGRVLDGGALGIIAPQVESAADAARVVACCRHPPRGRRSYAGGQAALGYRDLPQAEAMAALDASVLTAVMIESRNALDAVEAIASVDGLDLLFIGAHDLAADLGLAGQWDHPALLRALARIRQACLDAGKALGLGGLAGQPALRELAARRWAAWSRRARTWPACSARPRSAPPPRMRCATRLAQTLAAVAQQHVVDHVARPRAQPAEAEGRHHIVADLHGLVLAGGVVHAGQVTSTRAHIWSRKSADTAPRRPSPSARWPAGRSGAVRPACMSGRSAPPCPPAGTRRRPGSPRRRNRPACAPRPPPAAAG